MCVRLRAIILPSSSHRFDPANAVLIDAGAAEGIYISKVSAKNSRDRTHDGVVNSADEPSLSVSALSEDDSVSPAETIFSAFICARLLPSSECDSIALELSSKELRAPPHPLSMSPSPAPPPVLDVMKFDPELWGRAISTGFPKKEQSIAPGLQYRSLHLS
jgi:hypothetical protein